jgi:RNA polymerase sigma-70 factor (ECF subfamily)
LTTDIDALFRAHEPKVFRFLCRVVGHADTARDLTQDVFLRVAGGRMPAVPAGDELAWMYRVARNLALDHLRHAKVRSVVEPVAVARPAAQDIRTEVRAAIESLPELDRHVFWLREVTGFGYAEIAVACDLTPDAVRSRIHRSRIHLRERLAAPISHRQNQHVSLRKTW